MACCAIYMSACLLMRSTDLWMLVGARVLSGVASSMMHSVFESWLGSEARRLNAPPAWRQDTFSVQVRECISECMSECVVGVRACSDRHLGSFGLLQHATCDAGCGWVFRSALATASARWPPAL